ncbi:ABC transporter ATP-binding protein [Zhaonella formicivorans]|uniref:ABC transporter ATP-binding protein n=1 Tax=Zhaonella formicivorans TaxID=2528593 RepID=UPI0010D546EA|nr:ABC transporter ATP-binding protein [Zhaonella formicivorans]
MTRPLVEMRQITKSFPGTLANDRVDFTAYPGEIHALLGENGAGKSTLMSILTGLYRPDSGQVFVKGQEVVFRSPKDAINAGIGMVHQHFRLVKPFTVAENVILGLKGALFLNVKEIEQSITAISQKFGLGVEPQAKVWQLSVGEQQRVEIIKMLYRGTDILILDEPTAVLTPQEVRELFKTLRNMADSGCAVIFITHKMHEVMEFADRITVLRGGKSTASLLKKETNSQELARLMVGRELNTARKNVSKTCGQDVVLELQGVCALNDKGRQALSNLCLELRSGEILGIAGVAGNGQRELSEVITGLRNVTSGSIKLLGQDITNKPVRDIIDAGVAFIPEDRTGTGLIPNLPVVDNIILKEYRSQNLGKGWLLDSKAIRHRAQQLVNDFAVKIPNIDCPVKLMSGGNLQKLLLARETSLQPKLVVAVYPVRGLDIGATDAIHDLLIAEKNKGAAVLMISEDLEEIYKLADRVAVMYEGEFMGVLPIEEADLEEIGLMMAGAKRLGGVSA